MPNRMLRDWTASEKMKEVSVYAERFFIRLIMKVDDYGCFYAAPSLLKASLFPHLLDTVREADITRWMTECQKAGLILLYENSGKKYLQIVEFRQRLDKSKAKYPLPNENEPVNDFPESVNHFPSETEAETETKTETEACVAGKPPDLKDDFLKREKKFMEDLAVYVQTYGRQMVRAFYDYWREPNRSRSKMRWEQERTWDTKLRLQTWERNEANFKNKKSDQTSAANPLKSQQAAKAIQEIRGEQA